MIQYLIRKGNEKRRQGWRLTVAEELCVRVGDLLTELEATDPSFLACRPYAKLIAEYNARASRGRDKPATSMNVRWRPRRPGVPRRFRFARSTVG
jgi:hypothetical protein